MIFEGEYLAIRPKGHTRRCVDVRNVVVPPLKTDISRSIVATVITDPTLPDNPIVECNEAFEILSGYSRAEIIGNNCRFLAGKETEPEKTQILRDAIKRQVPVICDIINYKKTGEKFINAVTIAPIFDESGKARYFIGSQYEARDYSGFSNENSFQAIQSLSERQKSVIFRVAEGKLNKVIADELHLSERTVKMHRCAAMKKLGVKSSAEAIRMVIEATK